MTLGTGHYIEDLLDELEGDVFMKEVAHGIDEDAAGLSPVQGHIENMGVERNLESVAIVGLAHRF